MFWRLVGVVHTSEAGEVAGPGPRVEPLRVTLLAHLDRRVHMHLQEWHPRCLVEGPGPLAGCAVGADEGYQGHQAGVGKQSSDLGDPAYVLVPIVGRETQVTVEAVAKVVAVEKVGGTASRHQQPFTGGGYRGLTRAG